MCYMARFAAVLFLFLVVTGMSFAGSKEPTVTPTSTPVVNESAQANNLFSFDPFRQYQSTDGNIFLSPFSISSALAMTAEGTAGNTADEMWGVLHLVKETDGRRLGYAAMMEETGKTDKDYQFFVSNNLWPEKTFTTRRPYLDLTSRYYHASISALDFIGDPSGACKTINQAVEE